MSHPDSQQQPGLGLRGEVLLIVGLLWVLNAWVVYQTPQPTWREPVLHEILLPLWVRAWAWGVTGLVGIFMALFRRWPPGVDRWGFGALVIMPVERALSWLVSGIAGVLGIIPAPNIFLCVGQFIVWGLVALLIYRIGGHRQVIVFRQGEQP